MKGRNEVDDTEWRFLLTGGVGAAKDVPNPAPAWLPAGQWGEICKADLGLGPFEGFCQAVADHVAEWKAYYDSAEPYNLALPGGWEDKLNSLQKLIALRLFRPDKVTPRVVMFVTEKLGQRFV